MATLSAKPENKVNILYQKVKKAYLAEKEITGSEESGESYSYTFKGNNNTSTTDRKKRIAKIIFDNIKSTLDKQNQVTTKEKVQKVLTQNTYKKGDCIEIPLIKPTVKFNKLKDANFGEEVYVVIQTEHMPDRKIKLNLKQGKDKVLTDVDEPIYVTQDGQAKFMFTAIVGEFSKQKSVANAEDFKDYAIAKIKLESTNSDKNKEYEDALKKVEGEKTYLYLAMDAEPEDQNWFEVTYEEVFDNRPNLWYYGEENWFEVKITNTLFIYHDGKISKVDFSKMNEINYVYVDKNGKQHDLGKFNIITAQKWKGGSKKDKSGNKNWKKIKIGTKIRYFKYDIGKVPLIKIKFPIDYNKDGIKITLKDNTNREYINPEAYACLLGALAENDYKDVTFNGFTSKDGTGAPSVSHYNGIAGDFRYLRKDEKIATLHINTDPNDLDVERTESFIDALIKFGWTSFYSYDIILNNKSFRLKENYTTHLSHHHHHLHVRRENFKPNYK